MFKWWEKVDQWVGILFGIVITVLALKLTIGFVLWAGPVVKNNWILKFLFGWLF
jgi:uncharacterized membrane protein YagU involved in acid resistance